MRTRPSSKALALLVFSEVGFHAFDPEADFDVRFYLERCPEEDSVRAMSYDLLRRAYRLAGRESPDFPTLPFAKVPRRPYNQAMVRAAEDLFPDSTLAAGLSELGRGMYPHFASTMIGKAIFSIAGKDLPTIGRLAPRAYAVSNERGTVEAVHTRAGLVHARYIDVWDPIPFTCGIWLGGLELCSIPAESLEIDIRGPVDYDIRAVY